MKIFPKIKSGMIKEPLWELKELYQINIFKWCLSRDHIHCFWYNCCYFSSSSYSCCAFAVFIICSCYWFLCHWYWFTTCIATMISASSSVDASIYTLVIALSSTKWDTQQNRNLNILWTRRCLLRTPNSSYLCSSPGFSLFPKYLRQILATWQRYCNNLFRSGTLGFWPFLLPEITLWQAVIL